MNKIDVVVTARPSWARVKSLVENYASFFGKESVRVILAGSSISRNFGDISVQIPDGIEHEILHTLHDSDDLTSVSLSAFNLSSALIRVWAANRPDLTLVIADRTETLGASAAAAICQLPLVHLQGGELSGSIDNKIRDANSKLADLHLTTNEHTKQRLLNLGEKKELIHVVGCPSIDIVRTILQSPLDFSAEDVIGVGSEISSEQSYGIVMFHPDTLNEQENLGWLSTIVDLVESSELSWLWFWPNPDHGTARISKELRRRREMGALKRVKFVINLEPEKFVSVAARAQLIVGNSSFGIRESSYIGLPALNLGKRQRNRQKGQNVLNIEDLKEARRAYEIFQAEFRLPTGSDLTYGDGHSGLYSAKILGSWDPKIKD